MRLVSVELKNIRSYEHGFLNFPEGSTLLSGHIGSGKSTVLLATEFALFGIRRGELSGNSLLRRGKNSGFVKLTLSVDGKDVIIERKLKRTSSSIGQESGSIIIDGVETPYTPTELKAKILSLLGYPLDLLDKQKSLLYRYTVYTPQEQLKNIMWAEPEDRLNSLRKLFGVDRYKLIQENLLQFLTQLRAKKRSLSGIHSDLDEKIATKSGLESQLDAAKQQVTEWTQEENKIKTDLQKWKDKKQEIEEKVSLFDEYEKRLHIEKGNEKTTRIRLEGKEEEIKSLKAEIERLEKLESPTNLTEEGIKNEITSLEDKIKRCLTEPRGINKSVDCIIDEREGIAETIEGKNKRVTQIDTLLGSLSRNLGELKAAKSICPICGKQLDETHKDKIIQDFDKKMNSLNQEKVEIREELKSLTKKENDLQKEINEKLEEIMKSYEREKEEMEHLRDDLRDFTSEVGMMEGYVESVKNAEKAKESILKEVEKKEEEISETEKKLEELGNVKEKRIEIDNKIDEIQESLRPITGKLGSSKEATKQFTDRIRELRKEIERKEKARSFENLLSSYESWLRDHLINLAATIEKHYMVELKRKFDPLFSDWFNMLVDDEDMGVRIDDEFTPIIEKEGYEAEYETLSGGESASVALAYRLALNKVVNTMIDEIKTKDIIILDEPTDGFSNNQMDKIRDVVNELDAGQTIIVSHEPKIESYVDNIIRIRKEDGLSEFQS